VQVRAQTAIQRIRWFLVLAPIMGVAMIAAGIHGFTLPLVAFVFERWGHEADLVGLNAAAGTCGILLLGPFLPRIIAGVGLPRVVAAAITLATVALAAMAALPNVVAWFLFKALLGLSLSVIWAGAELWINLQVDDAHRGRAFSLFSLFYWLGFMCGPGIIGVAGIEGAPPLLIGAAVMASGFVLLLLMPRGGARIDSAGERRILRTPLWPALMVLAMAIMAGMGDGTLPALLPTFGLDHGLGEAGALTLLTAFVAGGIAFQWPVGWLADKVSERALAVACIGGAGLCLVLLPMAAADAVLRLPLCFVAGGLVMSISTLGLVVVGRTFAGGMLAIMSTWFSVLYEVGATVGPVVAGAAMVRWGPDALPLTLTLAAAVVGLILTLGVGRTRQTAAGASAKMSMAR
jgi:MFS family permease